MEQKAIDQGIKQKAIEAAVGVIVSGVLTTIFGSVSHAIKLPTPVWLFILLVLLLMLTPALFGRSIAIPWVNWELSIRREHRTLVFIVFGTLGFFLVLFAVATVLLVRGSAPENTNVVANILIIVGVFVFCYILLVDLDWRFLLALTGLGLVALGAAFCTYVGWITLSLPTNPGVQGTPTPGSTSTPAITTATTASTVTVPPAVTASMAVPPGGATNTSTLPTVTASNPAVYTPSPIPATPTELSQQSPTVSPTFIGGTSIPTASLPPEATPTPDSSQDGSATFVPVISMPSTHYKANVTFTGIRFQSYGSSPTLGRVIVDPFAYAATSAGNPADGGAVVPAVQFPGAESGTRYQLTGVYNAFSIQSYQSVAVQANPRIEESEVFGTSEQWGQIRKLYGREASWGSGTHLVNSLTNEEGVRCPARPPDSPAHYNGCFELEFTIEIKAEP